MERAREKREELGKESEKGMIEIEYKEIREEGKRQEKRVEKWR